MRIFDKIWNKGFIKDKGRFPDFMIIGAQKSGTSSMFIYLNQGKSFQGSVNKEVHFFDKLINEGKDIEWYKRQFVKGAGKINPLFFEATPNYLYYEKIPEILKEINPGLRFVILLREPVSRAFSAWNMYRELFEDENRRKGFEGTDLYKYYMKGRKVFPSFSEAINIELNLIKSNENIVEPSIIRRGFYAKQIRNWFKYFPREQFLVLQFEEFKQNLNGSLAEVYDFLGVDSEVTLKDDRPANKRTYNAKMTSEDKNMLKKIYQEPNNDLMELLGKKFSW